MEVGAVKGVTTRGIQGRLVPPACDPVRSGLKHGQIVRASSVGGARALKVR
jgi:hypothetical protein